MAKVSLTENSIFAFRTAGSHFEEMVIPHSILSHIPYALALDNFLLPFGVDEKGRIEALMAYPGDTKTLQRIQQYTGKLIRPIAVPKEKLLRLIAKHYGAANEASKHNQKPKKETIKNCGKLSYNRTDTTTVLVDDILHEAIRLRASDIHLEPFEREMCVRFRIDGVLQEMLAIPRERVPEVSSRIKIMAGMDIAEKRRAQDGRIRINNAQHDVDIRVSTLPTDFGEKLVLRLLDKSSFDFNLDSIGMDPKQASFFRRAIQMPNGIVLITGPTGSGKSTTLYGIINYLKKPGLNISTIEDPIEYNIAGVNQTQVNTLTGVTFASSLRTLLRQDPDIIMVGEMRDQETGEIAVRSSLTGHLVLSTLHTNDAPSAITRLVDMGIEPYLVASSVTMIVAQRLVRKICDHCKCEEQVPENIRQNIGLASSTRVFKGLGCSACGYTGYQGRTGIFEVLPISEQIRSLIKEKAYASEIRNQAIQDGLISLRDHALTKLQQGVTSFEEVLREVSVLS
jgi:type II secretory ATPase GspE/PulE/Tfp pilus assembly ATPase PilB-like protein